MHERAPGSWVHAITAPEPRGRGTRARPNAASSYALPLTKPDKGEYTALLAGSDIAERPGTEQLRN